MDYPLDCDSVPTECERSDKVVLVVGGVEASLFHSNKLWCSCHGDNCTAKLAFRYNVSEGAGGVVEGEGGVVEGEEGHVSTAWKDPAWISSQSSSAPHGEYFKGCAYCCCCICVLPKCVVLHVCV